MTMMTVNEVSKLTGVSIRTLQYYDTIGLLKPIEYTESGYRLYDDEFWIYDDRHTIAAMYAISQSVDRISS